MAEILLVEDEESVNRGIEFTLTKEGYQVQTAGTIREAEEILKGMNPQSSFTGSTSYSYTPNRTFSIGLDLSF